MILPQIVTPSGQTPPTHSNFYLTLELRALHQSLCDTGLMGMEWGRPQTSPIR